MIIFSLLLVFVTFSKAEWNKISSYNAPGRLRGHNSVYCAKRDSLVLFGGQFGDNFSSKLWEYSFKSSSWSSLPSNSPQSPSGRIRFSFTVIPSLTESGCRAIIYGGSIISSDSYRIETQEVWMLEVEANSTKWTSLPSPGPNPGPRSMHKAVYRRGAVIIFGGQTNGGKQFNDLWELSFSNIGSSNVDSSWRLLDQSSDSTLPRSRFSHAMTIYTSEESPSKDMLFIHGGRSYGGSNVWFMLSDLLMYNFESNTWKSVPGSSLERMFHEMVLYDSNLIFYGGVRRIQDSPATFYSVSYRDLVITQVSPESVPFASCKDDHSATSLWCRVDFSDDEKLPTGRYDFSSIMRNDTFYIYGGEFQDTLQDFWSFKLSSKFTVTIASDNFYGGTFLGTIYFMMTLLAVLIACFLIIIINIRHRRRFSGAGNALFTIPSNNRPPANHAAMPSVIEALPTKRYHLPESTASSSTEKSDGDDLRELCAICLTDYVEDEIVRILPCQHFFHIKCIDTWLATQGVCPMCKFCVGNNPETASQQTTPPLAEVELQLMDQQYPSNIPTSTLART